MRQIRISDETMKRSGATKELALTFKEKLELAKLLDGLGVDIIEIEGIEKPKADALRIKSIASIVKNCTLAVPVAIDGSDVQSVWDALTEAHNARLQVQVAASPARMEYVHKMKAPALLDAVENTVRECAKLTQNVEFIAEDATRTDGEFLSEVITKAIDSGASTITICDDAGTMLPTEFSDFIGELFETIPKLKDVTLGISCSNELYMVNSTAFAGIVKGVGEVKATSFPLDVISLPKIAKIIADKGEAYNATCSVKMTSLGRTIAHIERICSKSAPKPSLFPAAASADDNSGIILDMHDTKESIAECVAKLGYDLSDEDIELVYEAFQRIASKKQSIDGRELDAIVASAALQVPPTYKIERYTINSGNCIKATAYVQISIRGEMIEKTCMGDGPIDAAFAAIDEIVGKSYELDDWQMQSVTEGQEAMGEAVIKLMSDGKIYSGRGISTDIIGSSIRAYINALNKVVYEEENE
ncbi:alpha-isopropylmalate synthase regulatory domain-containing protein [Adlercreutzia sp. ZJ304]|uniref:alpha-isopropylmalate synthase regulatory domain-containing protein n=1 Tax=Adlercreutzia sp. ZJ304 TaxID=2709791 RepID=UPI0013EBAFC1|nr:alpha-isopropylmalate synthase regulatory domain-containing protein [Adlercreutzia sp. ZJ304]